VPPDDDDEDSNPLPGPARLWIVFWTPWGYHLQNARRDTGDYDRAVTGMQNVTQIGCFAGEKSLTRETKNKENQQAT